jgi:hypothetical protein
MDKKYVLGILGSALLGFLGVMLLMPPTIDDGTTRLPWHTRIDQAGHNQVFGFTLGETTLAQVREVFGDEGKINLFETPGAGEPYEVEVFFEHIYLQSLRANFVMTLDLDQARLGEMYDHGLRISKLGSGSKKIKLDPTDVETLQQVPIRAITYLPQARLDEALLAKRFGEPSKRLTEEKTDIVHWLYPERGIDLGRDPDGKVVIQYVDPAAFPSLLAPLTAEAASAKPASAP